MPQSKQWVFNAYPDGLPTTTGANPTFKQVEATTPALQDGEVLLKNLYFSNDPAQRPWLNRYEDEDRLYVTPGHPGDLMRTISLAEVVETTPGAAHLSAGDRVVLGAGAWTQYDVRPAAGLQALPPLPAGLPITHYLGALGGTGLTAYHGLVDVGRAGPDDVVVVSGAAGATGSMAVQVAKRMLGCRRVVGLAGGAAKCRWVREALGADACVDYKAAGWRAALREAAAGATVYFDNVGGDILDVMLGTLARHGRVVACGAISGYNDAKGGEDDGGVGCGPRRNWFDVITMRIRIEGFIVLDFADQFAETRMKLWKALEEGKLDVSEGEYVVETKFEDVPQTWLKLFEGGNTGKLVTKLV